MKKILFKIEMVGFFFCRWKENLHPCSYEQYLSNHDGILFTSSIIYLIKKFQPTEYDITFFSFFWIFLSLSLSLSLFLLTKQRKGGSKTPLKWMSQTTVACNRSSPQPPVRTSAQVLKFDCMDFSSLDFIIWVLPS